MAFKATLAAITVAAGLAQGASAATINFASTGTGAGGLVGIGANTYGSSASYTTNAPAAAGAATVTVGRFGLGVDSPNDIGHPGLPSQISGQKGSETLTITFAWAVKLLDITFARLDSGDDFDVSLDGGMNWSSFGPGFGTPSSNISQLFSFGGAIVSSFSIRASDSSAGRIRDEIDNFTLASANVAAVPVPAAGLMLLAGLGGLAALRRRKALA